MTSFNAQAPVLSPGAREAVRVFVGLGGNLGDAVGAVRRALLALASLPETDLLRHSGLYRSAPVESSGPDYINAVAELSTRLPPQALLEQLQQLELAEGRVRPYRNAPRTLDLDLLMYGAVQMSTPTLTLPHPRMGERAFVLLPLWELAPELMRAEQRDAVADQRIERMPD